MLPPRTHTSITYQISMDNFTRHINTMADHAISTLKIQLIQMQNPYQIHSWVATIPGLIPGPQCIIRSFLPFMPQCHRNSPSLPNLSSPRPTGHLERIGQATHEIFPPPSDWLYYTIFFITDCYKGIRHQYPMTPPPTCLSNYKNSTMPNNPWAGNSSIMAAYLPSRWPSTIRTIQQQETVSTTTPSTSPSFGKLSYASGSFGTSIYTWSAPCQSTSSDSTPNHTQCPIRPYSSWNSGKHWSSYHIEQTNP